MSFRRAIAGIVCAIGIAAPSGASAQEWLIAGQGSVASGVDVSGKDAAIQRARTTLKLGAELSVDERPKDVFAGSLLVQLEPRSSFGGSLRYLRMLAPKSALFLGGEALVAPRTLFGAGGGFSQRISLSQKTQITAGPSFNVFFIGQDIPDDTVFWQALLEVGFRANL